MLNYQSLCVLLCYQLAFISKDQVQGQGIQDLVPQRLSDTVLVSKLKNVMTRGAINDHMKTILTLYERRTEQKKGLTLSSLQIIQKYISNNQSLYLWSEYILRLLVCLSHKLNENASKYFLQKWFNMALSDKQIIYNHIDNLKQSVQQIINNLGKSRIMKNLLKQILIKYIKIGLKQKESDMCKKGLKHIQNINNLQNLFENFHKNDIQMKELKEIIEKQFKQQQKMFPDSEKTINDKGLFNQTQKINLPLIYQVLTEQTLFFVVLILFSFYEPHKARFMINKILQNEITVDNFKKIYIQSKKYEANFHVKTINDKIFNQIYQVQFQEKQFLNQFSNIRPFMTKKVSVKSQQFLQQFVIYDSVQKVCGIVWQKYFIFVEDNYKQEQILNELIFIQKVSTVKQIFEKIQFVKLQQINPIFYIFDLKNKLNQSEAQQITSNKYVKNLYSNKFQKIFAKQEKIKSFQNFEDLVKIIKQLKNQNRSDSMYIPNYNPITGRQKSFLNQFRFNFNWMLRLDGEQNILKSKFNCLKFVKQWLSWEPNQQKMKQQHKLTYNEFQQIVLNSSLKQSKQILVEYLKDNFVHKILNQSLRALHNCKQIAYIRYLFVTIYNMINNKHKVENPKRMLKSGPRFSNDIKCHRGCFLAQMQITQLEKFENQYIELEGFISTSLQKSQSEKFGNGGFIHITIKSQVAFSKQRESMSGFAYVKQMAAFKNEEEILFNPMNIFKILRVDIDSKTVQLELCDINLLCHSAEARTQQLQQLISYSTFMMKSNAKYQGNVMKLCGYYEQAEQFFNKQLLFRGKQLTHCWDLKNFSQLKILYNFQMIQDSISQIVEYLYSKNYDNFIKEQLDPKENTKQTIQKYFQYIILHEITTKNSDYLKLFSSMVISLRILSKVALNYLLINKFIIEEDIKRNAPKMIQSKFSKQKSEVYLNLAKYYSQIGDYKKSIEYVQNQFCLGGIKGTIFQNTPWHASILKSYGAILALQMSTKVQGVMKQSYRIDKLNGVVDQISSIGCKYNEALSQFNMGKLKECLISLRYCKNKYENLVGIKEHSYVFTTRFYMQVCFIAGQMNQFRKQKQFIEKFIQTKLSKLGNILYIQWSVLMTYARVLLDCRQYEKILSTVQKYLPQNIEKLEHFKLSYCQLLVALSSSNFYLGKYGQYKQYKQKGVNALKNASKTTAVYCFPYYGILDYQDGKYSQAIEEFQRAKYIMVQNKMHRHPIYILTEVYLFASKIKSKRIQSTTIQPTFQILLTILKQFYHKINSVYICNLLTILSEAKIYLNLYQQAEKIIIQAKDILEKNNSIQEAYLGDVCFIQSKLWIEKKDFSRAEEKVLLCQLIRKKIYGKNTNKFKQVQELKIKIQQLRSKSEQFYP